MLNKSWASFFFITGFLALASCFSSTALAAFTFSQITSNGAESPVAQLSVEVSDSSGQVLFKFLNDNISGAFNSRISEVYWDDELGLLSAGPIVDAASTSAGVNMSMIPASPGDLPSGNATGFMADYSAGRVGGAGNGVELGESAGFLFDGDLTGVINAISSGDLVLGMHVISIGQGGQSESFVSDIPEPASISMLALGLLGIGLSARRRVR